MRWDRFGSRLGVGLAMFGFVLIFLGWNGAASVDRVPSQFPYLISGGVAGLGLVIVGAVLMLVQAGREDRARLRADLDRLRETVEKLQVAQGSATTTGSSSRSSAPSGSVAIGPTSYHRPDCRLLEGRDELPMLSVAAAAEQGLEACRVCNPTTGKRPGRKRKASRPGRGRKRKAPASRKR